MSESLKNYDESHNYYHSIRVLNNASDICKDYLEKEEVTTFVENWILEDSILLIFYSALVHDICDKKYVDPEEGLKKIRAALESKLSEKIVDGVIFIIQNISYSTEKKFGYPKNLGVFKLARDIVSDSDKIDALGEVGIKRCFTYSSKMNPDKKTEEIWTEVYSHSLEKLVKLRPDYIRTPGGQKLSTVGHQRILNFIKDFEKKNQTQKFQN